MVYNSALCPVAAAGGGRHAVAKALQNLRQTFGGQKEISIDTVSPSGEVGDHRLGQHLLNPVVGHNRS